MQGEEAQTTACLSKRCYGLCVRAARGATCLAEFGKWNRVYKRFCDWVKADVFHRFFDAVNQEPDMEYVSVDARCWFCAMRWATW